MSDLTAGVADQIGVQPRPSPATGGVPAGSAGSGQIITKAAADAQNARLRSQGYAGMPVMPTDFVFGKGLVAPPGAGQVGSPNTATGDAGRVPEAPGDTVRTPPKNNVVAGVPMTPEGHDPAYQFIDYIGRKEGANWDTLYGNAQGWNGRLTQDGVPIVNGQPWQGAAGPDGRPTHAFGKGQFQPATWRQATRELGIDVTDASAVNQARVMLHLAQKRDPHFLDKFVAGDTAGLSASLGDEWTSLKGDGQDTALSLRNVALGGFNSGAMPMIQNWQADLASRRKVWDQAIVKADRLDAASEAALARWQSESDKPPKNMHEAWSQWNGIASAFALLGGLVGRNHTAAIAAAGTMLQAANAADSHAYDRAYGEWKDHLDRGLKLVDLLHQRARNIVDDARKSYEDKVTELGTLSTAYHLNEQWNPQSVENVGKKLDIARKQRDLIEAQNEQTEVRNSAGEKDKTWLEQHPEANGQVPASLHNQHVGEAERERKGTTASGQMMQFKMAQAAELEAGGMPHEQALRTVGLIPQLPKKAAGSEEAKFIESQVSADRSAKQSKGEPYGPEDEQASRLKAREDWSRSAAAGRVAAGRPETASDRALQWKMQRAKELIEGGTPKDDAYRQVGLEPQQRAAGLENQFIQASVSQAEAEAESNGHPFTEADRNTAMANAHQEWARRTAAGRVAAGRPETASDRSLQWKLDRAKELIQQGASEDQAYRMVGLEPQQRAVTEQAKIADAQIAIDRAEKEAKGEPYTISDEQASRLKAHREWAEQGSAGRNHPIHNIEITDANGQKKTAAAEARPDGWYWANTDEKVQGVPGSLRILPNRQSIGVTAVNQNQRIVMAANDIDLALQNFTALPMGTTLGLFSGAQAKTPDGLADALRRNLANSVTPQGAQFASVLKNGLSRALAGMMSSGAGQGLVGLSNQLEGDVPQANDTNGTLLFKIADMAAIAQRSIEVVNSNPLIGEEQKALLQKISGQLNQSVPFSPQQIIKMNFGDKQSIRDFSAKIGASDAQPASTATLPENARAQLSEGHETKFGNGQIWTLQGGQPRLLRKE